MPMTFAGRGFVEPAPDLLTVLDRWWVAEAPELWKHPGYATERLHHLPVPDRPIPSRARYNTLYWPGGASRWGVFHGFMWSEDLVAAAAVTGTDSPTSAPLVLSLNGETVTVQMFLLDVRPVFVGGASDRQLFHVTLVDQRYYWWLRELDFDYTEGDSWADLLTNLTVAASGLTPTVSAVPAAYGVPTSARWVVRSRPLPLILDAAAAAVGLRVVVSTDGTVAIVTAAEALIADTVRWAAVSVYTSFGGRIDVSETAGNIPESVSVVFWGDVPTSVNVTLASLALPEYGTLTGVTNAVAFVGVDQRASLSSPVPSAVASQAAADYYGWALSPTDATLVGVRDVELCGLEDRIEWEWHPGRRIRVALNPPDREKLLVQPIDYDAPIERVVTRIVPSDRHDRNLYGDRPPPGYTYAVTLDEKSPDDGDERWKAVIRVADGATKEIVDGPQLGWSENAFVLFADAGQTAGAAGTAVPDPFVNNAWVFVPSSGRKTYIVKLTGSGTGVDGGTAWAGKIQVENGTGSVVDNGFIGTDPLSATYCMYKTKSYDGSPGVPEINDIVIAVPDKDRPGVWDFIPKMVSGADCQDCCWFVDMAAGSCVTIQQLGGEGRCQSVPSGGKIDAIYIPSLGGWMALEMGTLACGCGGTIFKPTLQPNGPSGECTASIELRSYHVSCAGGSGSGSGASILDGTMLLSCCGRDLETGQPFAIFVGWGAGPCEDIDQTGCDNTFRIKVQCAPCPSAPCVCTECETCCEGTSPFGYYALMVNFSDQKKNGWWIWKADTGQDCVWRATCGEGSGAYVSTLEALPQPGGADTIWRLTHQGSVYESTLIIDCCDTILLSKVSGDGPATVQLQPIKLDGVCPTCPHTWPETLTFTVTNIILTGGAAIGFNIGDTFMLTKLAPAPGLPWDTTVGWGYNYTSPTPGIPELRFRCVDQVAACRGFTIQGVDGVGTFSFCMGVGGTVVPCADSPPDSVSTLIDCTCSPVYFEGSDYEKCDDGSCPYGPLNSSVFIQGTVTE